MVNTWAICVHLAAAIIRLQARKKLTDFGIA